MTEFKFPCPHCSQHIQATEAYAGMQIACPSCQGVLLVPALSPCYLGKRA
jgi:DNA-directed RNA polymerase subunit RPC12/RpoP